MKPTAEAMELTADGSNLAEAECLEQPMLKAQSLKQQAAFLFTGKIIAYVITSISPIILVRLMARTDVRLGVASGETFGSYRQILWLAGLTSELMRMSVPSSLYYFFPRMRGELGKFMSQTVTIQAIAGSTVTVVFLICCGGFGWLPSGVSRHFVPLLAIYLLLDSFSYLIEHVFIVEKRAVLVLGANVSGATCQLMFVLVPVLLFGTITSIVYGLVCYSIIRAGFLGWYLVRRYRIRLGLGDLQLLREQIHYMLPLAASCIVGMIGVQVDKGIVSTFPPEQFAIYSLGGLGVLSAVTLFTVSIGNVCLSRLGELSAANNLEGMRQLWHKLIVVNAALILPAVCLAYALAPQIVTVLYTKRYIASAGLLRINLFILILTALEYGRIPMAMGKTRAIMTGNIVRTVVGVVLAFTLIWQFGLVGGTVASVLAYWSNGVVQLYVVKKGLRSGVAGLLPWGRLAGIFAISAAGGLVAYQISRLGLPLAHGLTGLHLPMASLLARLSLPDLLALMLAAPVYIVVVAGLFYWLGFVSPKGLRAALSGATA